MVYYTKVKRDIKTGFSPGFKYLCVISRNGVMNQEDLADRIADMSSLAYNDVLSALAALQLIISQATMNGITVSLRDFGNFTPVIHSRAMDSLQEADSSSIKRLKVNFYPNVRFKNRLKSTGYVYRDPIPEGFVSLKPVIP